MFSENGRRSHLLYADDLLLFLNGSKRSLDGLLRHLHKYEQASGQRVNYNKSCFILPSNASQDKKDRVIQWTGFSPPHLPIKYLGAPLFKGRAKKRYFEDIVNAVRSKIEGWKASTLCACGKLTLINSVLGSIPIHVLSGIPVPQVVIRTIQRLIANFFGALTGNLDIAGEHRRRY